LSGSVPGSVCCVFQFESVFCVCVCWYCFLKIVSVSIYVNVCVVLSICVRVCECVYVCQYMSMCQSVCCSLCQFESVLFFVCVGIRPVCRCVSVCLCVSICRSMCCSLCGVCINACVSIGLGAYLYCLPLFYLFISLSGSGILSKKLLSDYKMCS